MRKQFGFFVLLLLWQQAAEACHIYEYEGHDIRRKRQSDLSTEAASTKILRKYFADCLQNTAGAVYDWQSVVGTSVLDTFWYEGNDEDACSLGSGHDTASCWIARLPAYLQSDSQLVEDTAKCINQYAFDVDEGKSEFQGLRLINEPKRRRKRQIVETEMFSLLSPEVKTYIACIADQVQLPTNREDLDYSSLIDFVQSSTACSPELSGCGTDGMEILSGGVDVPNWPYRFQAIIKPSSPLSTGIAHCNDRIFPLIPPTDTSTTSPITTSMMTMTPTITPTTTTPAMTPTTTPLTASTSVPGPEVCARLDLVVVFDSSSSIGARSFLREKTFIRKLLSGIPVSLHQIKVAGVRFDAHPKYIWNFSNSSSNESLMPKINGLMYQGGDRVDAPNMVILMTDGKTSDDLAYRAPRFRRAARTRLIVVPVNDYNVDKINSLASPPSDENIYFMDETEKLISLVMKVATAACVEY